MFFYRIARWFWVLLLAIGLAASARAAVLIVEEGTDPNGYFIESTPVNSGDTFTSRTAPLNIDAYRFAYWKINGVRQADHVGRALNPVKFTVRTNSTLIAVYTLSTGDADLDSIFDYYEYEFYGDLTKDSLSDTDSDGFNLLMEFLQATHPVLVDSFVEGGISGRSTGNFDLSLNPAYYQTTAQSDPFGLIPGAVGFQIGSALWALPNPPEVVDGLRFAGWYADGVRADSPATVQPASVSVTGPKTFSAKYIPEAADVDEDGLADWYEWFAFSGMSHTVSSDPDDDGLSIGLEKLMGFSPYLVDTFSEGGISGRTAANFQVNLAGYYWFTLTSDPSGFVEESRTLNAPGASAQTTDLFGANINGYRFVGWEFNGVRIADSAGAAAGRANVIMSKDRTAVARFVLDTEDSDADGVADWLERLYFGALTSNATSDLDGDGVDLGLELLWGTHPRLKDLFSEGGLSQRSTEVTDVIFEWMPSITEHPSSIDVPTGSEVRLRVVASWSGELGYQWRKNGVDISGATSPELVLSNVAFSDSAKYDVAVYNPGVRILSASAIVSVDGKTNGPFIITQPVDSRNLVLGGSVTLSVVGALGGGTWGYQWVKDGLELPGATAGSLSIASMQPWNAGDYTVRVKKTVNTSVAEAVADTATLAIKNVDGTLWKGLLAYYKFDGNANDSSPYLIHGTLKAGAAFGADQNSLLPGAASLKVSGAGAVIPDSPLLATACSVSAWARMDNLSSGRIVIHGDQSGFDPFELSVDVFGRPTFGSSEAGGAMVTAADSLRVGEWSHLVGVYDQGARSLALYVNAAKVAEGSGVSLATGVLDPNLEPGWGIGSHPGLLQTTLNKPLSGSIDNVRLYGRPLLPEEVTKIYVAEAASTLPSITAQPLAAVVNEGDNHVFSVTAVGAGLTYQWYVNGAPVIGGNTSRLEMYALTLERSGVYTVSVTNKAGTVSSANALLKVVPIPRLFQDVTPQVKGLTGYSSAALREVANAAGAAPYYLSTDNDVLKLYSQPAPFQFTDVSTKVLPAGFKWAPGSRLLVADFDNNGSQDLVLWETNGLRVLLNTAGTFKEASVPAGLNPRLAELKKTLLDVLAADIDGDGDLDLVFRYIASGTAKPGRVGCVYNDAVRNSEGRQAWTPNATGFARVADVLSLSYSYGGMFAADLNLDGKADLILGEMASASVNDKFEQRSLHLFFNNGSGVLEETGTPLTGMADSLYGFAFADYQGTGRLDLIQGSSDWPWAGSYPHAYWSTESGAFEKSATPVLERLSGDYHFELSTADFDLDGRSDAFWSALTSWSAAPMKIWRQTAPKTFLNLATEWGLGKIDVPSGSTPGAISLSGVYARQYRSTVADFDGDGAPDLLFNYDPWSGSTQRIYRNNAVQFGANYLKVRLTGVASARDGTGARIEVRTGSNVAVRYNTGAEQSNLPFGLGSAKTADLVKVYWPSGKVSEAKNVPGNQWLEVVEPSAAQFEVIRGRFTWPEAVADAAKRGGRPAVLSTPELQRQGNALQVGPDAVSLWIGLSDEVVNGTFRWIDGTPSTRFTNWSPSEPNDYFGPASENNVEMYANGKWNDLPGTFPLPGYLFERTGGALRITKQPESVSVNFAAPFSLSVTAAGAGNIAYRWFKDGQEIVGATSGTLSVSALTRSGVGTYWVVVSEVGKSLTSEKAVVTMANPPPVPTDALLAWWPLDGNAIDQGPNAIHGTLTGPTAGTDRFNRVTRTLEFVGTRSSTAFVDFGPADKLRVSGDSTVVHWVKFADSDTPTPRILQFGAGQLELSTSAGRGPRAVQYTVGGVTLKSARLLEAGKWHHIAAVRKAGRGFLYINGRLDAEGPLVAAPAFGKTLNLGLNAALPNGAFAGALDDLRIYGRALTSLEIEALFSQPDGGDILPPVIVQDPKSLIVDVGVAAQFAVKASGSRGVLYYQWLKDGVELPGATGAVLTLPKVEARHTGAYACVVSDGYAKVTSTAATLGVNGVNVGLWQGLVGHWKLDGNGLDSSGFANHATMRGTPAAAADRFGVGTGAFSFGGNGAYFEVGDRAAFDLNKSDATLSAWVKTSSAAEGWLLSKLDPSKAGGIGIGSGTPAALSSQAVTYFKLSQAGGGYQRIQTVGEMNLVAGNVYEVSAVMPADFEWGFGDVFQFYPAAWYIPPNDGIIEAVNPSGQAKAAQRVGDHVEFRYRFKSLFSFAGQHPMFAFYRGARQLVEIGNIELRNITTGELLTPPLNSATLATEWNWDSAETIKHRTATIGAAASPTLGARTMLWGNGAASAKRASDSAQLSDNKWHLVTAVYDRKGKMRLYVDGTKRAETDLTAADMQVTNEHPLRIGAAVGAQSLTGTLDDVRWYNRALSDSDVLALYKLSEVVDTDGDGLSDAYEYGWGRYELVRGSYTWAEAKAHAEAKGGHLATITSEAEWQAIKTVVGPAVTATTLWLGGTDEGSEGRWRWITGEKWNFAKWGRNPGWGQEPNGATSENTLMLWTDPSYVDRPNGFIWNDSNNVVRWGYLFERGYFTDGTKWDTDGDGVSDSDEIKNGTDPTNPDSGLPGGTLQNQYSYVSGRLTWKEAKADAEKRGGHLGTITSASEWETASRQIGDFKTKIMWLGGYRESRAAGASVGWKWTTAEPFSFTWWHFGEPNGDVGSDGVGYLMANHPTWKGGDWNDGPNNHIVEGYLLEIERTPSDLNLAITTQPAPVTVPLIGGTASFTVAATGLVPLSYQWKKDGVVVPSADQATLSLKNVSAAQIGKYTVVVGDASGKTVTSNEAALAITGVNSGIWSGPVLIRQPIGLRMPPGSSGTLRVEASGDAPLAYQWQKDGVDISGATAFELPLNNVTEALQGSYRVRVSNGAGAVFSEAVLVDVLDAASNVTVYVSKNGSDTTGDGTQAKPFITIGKAVRAAAAGARILVGPGTYVERVEYAGKSLRIHSSEGPASTVLQGAAGNTVVYIDAAAANAELRGFKITGGTGRPSPSGFGFDYYGGGVHCTTSALISDCIFEGNGKGTPRVNSATFGGAIYSNGGKLQVVNCLINDNFAWASGGASLTESGSIEFDRCTVYGNDATQFFGRQGGLAVANGGRMSVRNCIVWGNTGSQLGAFGWPYNVGTEIVVEYSDIQSPNDGGGAQTFRNGTGNISNDPLFADASAKNFSLRVGSPALDKAAPDLPKEKDGTAADMGWRADRFGGEAATIGSRLFVDVTGAVRLPQHELLGEIDAGQGRATDRLVRVADGTLQLWRVTGAFGYRDVTVAAGLPRDLLAPGFGGFYAVGDVDNNGAQDLVAWDASGLRVFLNNSGVFKAGAMSAALNSRAVEMFPKARGTFTLADLDGDGDLDAVFNYEAAGDNPGRIAQFTNGATLDGATGRRVWLAADSFSGVRDVMTLPWQKPHFSVTDSNNDGLPDLVVLETDGSWPSDTHMSHKAHVYLNKIGGTGAASNRRVEGLARYGMIMGAYTFAEAQADAVARGGHLLTVSSAGEWDAVVSELNSRATAQDLWLGAKYNNSKWNWETGEAFSYTNWEGGAPGSGTGGVYSAKASGKWKTAVAGVKMGYLLEWEPAFQEVEEAGLTAASEFSNFLSIDVDGDGLLDLVNGSSDWPSQSSPKVFYGNGDGTYRQAKAPFVGSERFYHHVARVADIDLDGRMDGWWSGLHNFSDLRARLWRGMGGGAFAEVGAEWGVDVGLPSGNLFLSGYLADWDGDGDLDLVASASRSGTVLYKVYRNNAADRGSRWLRVRLVGVESPRDGTGARVTVVSGERSQTQYVGNLSSDGSPLATQLLFGLGNAPAASQIVVTWPNGQLQYLNDVPAGQAIEIRQNTVVPDWLKFTEQPMGRTAITGTLVVFSATAVGSGTISYQWLKDGAPITGGTASSFRIAAAALTSVGDYQVVATNGVAKAVSAVARLEVAVPPSIVAQPVPVGVLAGTDVAFSVDAIGTAPLSYQWSKGAAVLAGATGRTLQLKGVGVADVGSYSVKVSNPAGGVTSTAAALSLLTPVQITKQPANVEVNEGAPIALSVTATGSPLLKYQWYRDANAIAGGTTAVLAVAKASAVDAGSYSVSVSNPAGETSSLAALVAVNLLPRVLNVEENLSVKEGTAFALVADVTGTAPLGYVWKKDGTVVGGQTAATLSVSAATVTDSGAYTVEVKNAVGLAAARVAMVSVQALPRIVTQPVAIDAVEGSSAVLSVAATGAQPLSYQWYKDGTAMDGQSSAVLSFSPLSATTHSGSYKVQVSNTVGRVFSETAVVSARPVLRITTQPASAELALGARGTFSVVASGEAPLTYQWYKDGATLPFATDDTLLIASVGKYSIGDYTVLVKDRLGNAVRSKAAALTVEGEPSTYWQGLMAHWKFSGDTRDGTPFLNHGKGSNVQTTADRFGLANSALRFSGRLNPLAKPLVSQNVTVAHSDSLQPPDKYTVVVWAKPEFAGENLAEVSPFMLGKRAGGDLRDVSYAMGAGFGAGALDRINGGGGQTGYVTGGTATLVNGQWQMYALTFDGGSLTLYRNGARVAVQAVSASGAAPNTGPLRLGSGSGDGYQEWFGCLDDIRLYNKVLSAEQVTELYTSENTPPEGAVAPAAIVMQPVGHKVPEGGPVTLRVEASGGAPLVYQWKRDGAVLTGATSAEYEIASAVLGDEGSYTVEVSNTVASVTSAPAFVDVVPAVVTDRLYVEKTGNDTTGTGASSAPFLTIAKAVQVARSGSRIQVGAGIYAERVEYRGKTLVIESSAGPLETVIQAPAGNTAVFIDAAAVNSELRGFKIAGGTGRALSATATSITFIGGGVCILTSALVQDCIIEQNGNSAGIRFKSQASFGGGVYSTGGTTQLVNCLIIGNHASEAGGAVFTERGTCELDRCTVFGNTVGAFNAQIGGLGVRDAGRMVVRNSIVRGNTGQQIGAQPFPYNRGTAVQIEYSAIEGGANASQVVSLQAGVGNISSDPMFTDVVAKNFALRAGSPALDAAAPGLPKEADGTAADMGYRQDRFGKKTGQTQGALFADVTGGAAAQLPEHSLVALVDAGIGAKVDRLVRVVSGRETAVRLWRASGEFAATDVTAAAGLPPDLGSGLLAVGDFDNNGAQDVVSWNASGLRVYLSTGGVFKAQTVSAAMTAQAKTLWAQNAGELEVADLNGDGLLDLACNYTVAGPAQPGRIGAFLASGAADATGRRSWGTTGGFTEFREVQRYTWAKPVFSLADVNSDGLVDLVVLETEGRAPEDTGSRRSAHVYLNRWRTNTASPFNEVLNHGIVGGNELSKFQVVDVNGDGKLDLVNGSAAEGSAEAATAQWFEADGAGTFIARTAAFTAGTGIGHRQFSEVDVDLDGVLDPVWLGADGGRDVQLRLWRGKGGVELQNMTAEWGVNAGLGAGWLHLDGYLSDWDGDGSQDLVVRGWDDASTQGVYKVYRNQAVSRGGKVVRVRLEGVRSPRDGQGAVIEVTAGGRKQIQYVGNLGEGYTVVKSFGLGSATTVEKIMVRWPSGTVQELTKFGSSALVEVKESVVPVDSVVLLRLPQSVVASSGQAVSLSCEAVGIGAGTLTYQWFKDGVPLVGANKSSFDLVAMGAANVGSYTVRLTFGTANVLTPAATVELAVPPTVVTQPQSMVLLPGQTARFSVTVSGTSPLSYQWFKGGAEMVGATNATLNVADVGSNSVGAYTVKVTNGAGSVTSAVANLTLATAPAITGQPAGGMFKVGSALVLSPTYTGTEPLRYQWYKDGLSVQGATAATLTLTPVALSSAGAYTVTVTNAFGSTDSGSALVEVSAPPSIVEQPVGVSVLQGQSFKLQVRAALGAAQTLQWFKGATPIAGAIGTEFAVDAAQLTDAGSYFVRVTNPAGMLQSTTVVVAVNVPPAITTQPVALTLKEGSSGALSVAAQGSATLSYQWQKNGVNIPGATTASYALKAATLMDAGFYSVKVSNAFGAVQSGEVEVSVLALPRITQHPAAVSAVVDDQVSFSVLVEGSGTLVYQWRKGGVAIPNASSTVYSIAMASSTDAGSYDVVVSNTVGSVTSSPALLAVSAPPMIVTQPVSRALNPGAALSLSVAATGTGPLTYQWSKDGQAIAGATAATYSLAAVQLGNAGAYTVTVSNAVGKATSQAVTVSINAGVSITNQPASLSVNPGSSATFSVSASGSAPLTYQWRKAGVNIPGATFSTYTIEAANAASVASYDVLVTNPVGTVLSAVARLGLNQAVAITTQPVGRMLGAGSTLELKVVATGTDPKTYQWSRNGVAIAGGTAATYTIASAQTSDAGTYTVAVSNMVNTVTSAPAVVELGLGVTITSHPAPLTLNPGTLAVFSVTATGGGTLTYQWKKNGTNITGGTLATYRIAAVKTTDAGTYTVVVGNQTGSLTSDPAELALNAPVAISVQPLGATTTAGTPYTFRVVATGTAPISYQWMKGGVNIAGATGATYTLDAPGSADSGDYTVRVSNMVNAVTSTVANLLVAGPPAITSNPLALNLIAGTNGTLTAKVRSTLQFTYQWKKDGTAIAAGTLYTSQAGTVAANTSETTLSLGLLNPSDLTPGSYSLTVTNAQGTASSTAAAVTVLFTKPKFREATLVKAARTFDLRSFPDQSGPTWSGLVPANETLRVTVLGEGTVTYAWRYTTTKASASGPIVLTSQTGPSLDFSQSGVNRGPGIYLCKATAGGVSTELKFIITSFAPAVAGSQVAALGAPLQIISEPVSVGAKAGGVVQLGVGVTAGKRSYLWFREGADGQTVLVNSGGAGFLRLDPLRASDSGKYFAVITDTEGNSVTSRPATVTVLPAND